MSTGLMWFREDLRVTDNTALYSASQFSKGQVIGIVIISPQEWHDHAVSPNRIDFWLRNLKELSLSLANLNIPLLIDYASNAIEVPALLLKCAKQHHCARLFFNQQYEINEARRDLKVVELFKSHGLFVQQHSDAVILTPDEVLKPGGGNYTVFTPYKNAWVKQFYAKGGAPILPPPIKQQKLAIPSSPVPAEISGITSKLAPNLWLAGEMAAQQRLQGFIQQQLCHYAKARDYPALDGTSRLSPYLSAGILSPRQCLQAALAVNAQQLSQGHLGAITWINELIWREFYKYILYHFPRVSMGHAFKLNTEKIAWENNLAQFEAWQQGQTGYPLIDAAMRQLKTLGWMHNRLRMLTAMFLVKDLLIDWRWGERYFMQHLIDGDLAANNGGWQWAASTGTDAVPYFRIFNPITQSKKFDPEGQFIRQYCPELASLNNSDIHNPPLAIRAELDYYMPVVDHARARLRALQVYQNV